MAQHSTSEWLSAFSFQLFDFRIFTACVVWPYMPIFVNNAEGARLSRKRRNVAQTL